MAEEKWPTAITSVAPNKLVFRGYCIDEMIGRMSFPQAIYLAIKGDLPDERQTRMIDAILVSSIDHGVTPPSCLASRTIASAGAPLNAALAGGILAISKHHGGAIEDAMNLFSAGVERKRQAQATAAATAALLIAEYKEKGKRLPGFGHRFHTLDPRTVRLFQMADETALAGEYIGMAKALEEAIEKSTGRRLPINVDGAIAAVLCEMGIPGELANALFIIARLPGLVAHVHEEQTRMRPMRHINSREHEYDGHPERQLP